MLAIIEKAFNLKQTVVDFIYEAEGELAIALENYAAEKGKKNSYGIKQQNLTIDLFLTNGLVNQQTPLEIFIQENPQLSTSDREILTHWQNNVIGLFEIKEIQEDSYQLMNWLTEKTYQVFRHSEMSEKEISRWQPGEILLTIIAPINESEWFFFSDRVVKGKLSQPKLAVAIGEFRENYPEFLYADAPDLLAQAWDSVAIYHQEFVDFFKSDQITLPGYQLNQKIAELQQLMSQKKLAEAGIDDSKSFAEMLEESGSSETEFVETASEFGANIEAVENLLKNKKKLSMVTPKVDLPPEIKEAERVTAFSHPKWGQMFIPTYEKLLNLLSNYNSGNFDSKNQETLFSLTKKYLEQPETNYYIWQQLKQQNDQALTQLLRDYLNQEDFTLETDLDRLLLKYNKSSNPQLPSIASIPLHLNNLFEAAVAQVQKTKSKTKKKTKKKGFW